jgi:hypothetical protein
MKLVFGKKEKDFSFGLFNEDNTIKHNRVGVLWFDRLEIESCSCGEYIVLYGYADSVLSFSLWLEYDQAWALLTTGQVEL